MVSATQSQSTSPISQLIENAAEAPASAPFLCVHHFFNNRYLLSHSSNRRTVFPIMIVAKSLSIPNHIELAYTLLRTVFPVNRLTRSLTVFPVMIVANRYQTILRYVCAPFSHLQHVVDPHELVHTLL